MNYNIGDYFLAIGVKNLLRKYFPVDYIADTNLQGQYFNEYYINEVINKKYDLLVIGGGGIIHGYHWPNGWFWLCEKELIKTIQIPFIVYGIGDNYWENEALLPKTVSHLQETIKYATSFSVRNDGSKERLEPQLGMDICEVPDPGFFVWQNYQSCYEYRDYSSKVIVQLANDKAFVRFGDAESNLVDSIADVVNNLPEEVIFLPHVYDDISLYSKIVKKLNRKVEIFNFGGNAFDNIRAFLCQYAQAKYVISMRGHSQIIPFAHNIPVICLSNHPKHSGLMNKMEMSDFVVDVNNELSSKLILDKIRYTVNNYDTIISRLKQQNRNFENYMDVFFEELKNKLR
ncbi:MAG: polysaccharide pyruvyl transferase family protein [Salinivirgaceae bacterium]|nr:polysaccharide pyruvyl transferase family protein [Salinivirgaceae bacterium]